MIDRDIYIYRHERVCMTYVCRERDRWMRCMTSPYAAGMYVCGNVMALNVSRCILCSCIIMSCIRMMPCMIYVF